MKERRQWWALVALLGVLVAAAGAAQGAALPAAVTALDQLPEIQKDLEEITGLKFRRGIVKGRLDKAGVRRYLEAEIKRSVKPKQLRAEELLLKKLGFVPQDYDLKQATVNLLTEQAAAFYDFRRQRLYLVESAQPELLEMALVHELAHALADQNFNLRQFIEKAGGSDDTALARMSVMEGQAMWLMAEYLARRMGLSVAKVPTLLETIRKQAEEAPDLFPVYKESPLYMRETLMFPYTGGMLFQQHLYLKLGEEGFRRPFLTPPLSTRHISHPESYLEGEAPAEVTLPAPGVTKAMERIAEGTLGELDHAVWLRQYVSAERAGELAPQWRGGRYRLLEDKKRRQLVLVYASRWATEEAARDFFAAYGAIQKGKWRRCEVSEEGLDARAGRGDDGYFRVERRGDEVRVVEGLMEPEPPGN